MCGTNSVLACVLGALGYSARADNLSEPGYSSRSALTPEPQCKRSFAPRPEQGLGRISEISECGCVEGVLCFRAE